MAEEYLILVDEQAIEAELEHHDGEVRVRLQEDGAWHMADLQQVRSSLYVVMVDSRPVELYIERRGAGADVTIGRHTYHVQIGRGRRAASMARGAAASDGLVRILAPMTGSVLEVRTAEGDEVEAGDVLVVIESMKMNNELRAPAGGVVERVGVRVDGQVEEGDELVAIRPQEAAEDSA